MQANSGDRSQNKDFDRFFEGLYFRQNIADRKKKKRAEKAERGERREEREVNRPAPSIFKINNQVVLSSNRLLSNLYSLYVFAG
jgi:hypothetical protein